MTFSVLPRIKSSISMPIGSRPSPESSNPASPDPQHAGRRQPQGTPRRLRGPCTPTRQDPSFPLVRARGQFAKKKGEVALGDAHAEDAHAEGAFGGDAGPSARSDDTIKQCRRLLP